MKIRKIMVSQPKPELERSPYFELARNFAVEIDFRPFIQIEPIPSRDFRKNRIDILSYGSVILTSKNAVDHYFRMCNEMRIIVPETMKYFCISEATAYYLQKYIQFRKRKIFSSNYSFAELVDIIKKKHKEEKFLLPCAIDSSDEYTELLDKEGIRYVKAPMYKAIYSTLTDINFSEYDLLVLFSSAGVSSLLHSFPQFKQHNMKIAAFGEQTAEAISEAGLNLHIHAPQPHAPSMAMALEMYLKGEQTNTPWQQLPFSKMGAVKKHEKKPLSKPAENKKTGVLQPGKAHVPAPVKKPVHTVQPTVKPQQPGKTGGKQPISKTAVKKQAIAKPASKQPVKKAAGKAPAAKSKKPAKRPIQKPVAHKPAPAKTQKAPKAKAPAKKAPASKHKKAAGNKARHASARRKR